MCDDEKYITDEAEEKQKELEEIEKENNPIRRKFKEIKNDCGNMECLINILLTALDNDFNIPATSEIIDYLFILKEHLSKHNELLDEFMEQLKLPNGKAKLISLSYTKFKD